MNAASFNYYQELACEVQSIPDNSVKSAYETGESTEVAQLLKEYLLIPWGFFATDKT